MSERYPKDVLGEETTEAKHQESLLLFDDPLRELREATNEVEASTRRMKEALDRDEAEDRRFEAEKTPCPNCGLPLVTEDNHRVRLGRGVLEIGRIIVIRVPNDPKAAFEGCVECLTRPALHWESMTERVYELEASKGAMEEKVDALERRVTTAVGTLYLRWWVVGLAILAFEVVHFFCYLLVKHFQV